uniref:Uncharacterized protein n=1 Tax=Brassica oleracea var. oleracea TaxID=109376 RepID=A0A0D3C9H7_BRAOL
MFALQSLQAHDEGNVVLLELLTVLPEEISDTFLISLVFARRSVLDVSPRFHRARSHPLLNYVFNALQGTTFDLAIEDLPQVLLYKVQLLKDTLLNADFKVVSGLACLMSEIGQATPCLIVKASSEALILTDALLRSGFATYIISLDENRQNDRNRVDEFTSSDESSWLDLPDGLLHFRNNLLELLVDICQLLHPTTFVSEHFMLLLPSVLECLSRNFLSFQSQECYIRTGFLEVSLSSMIETVNCNSQGSFSVVTVQVHKCSTILQQLAAICSLCERPSWKGMLCWKSLQGWLNSAVWAEYLKQGEAENIVREWSEALGGAGI